MATHKWMLYVRGGKHNPDISAVVSRVEVGLPVFVLSQVAFFFFRSSCTPPTLRTTWSRSQLPHSTSRAEDGVRFSSLCTQHFAIFACNICFIFFWHTALFCFFSFFLCLQHFFYFFCTQHCFFSSFFFCLQNIQFVSLQVRDAKSYFSLALITFTLFVHMQKRHTKKSIFLYRRVSLEIENSLPPP